MAELNVSTSENPRQGALLNPLIDAQRWETKAPRHRGRHDNRPPRDHYTPFANRVDDEPLAH